jgi:hypothetical protein
MMQNQQPAMPITPELFALRKMQPEEITNSASLVYCEGHFFPTTLHGIAVKEYGQPIYQLIETDNATADKAA